VVVVNHVLEHVSDPRSFLADLERITAPEGRVFVLVPYYRGWIPRLMKGRWIGWFPSQHMWHFRPVTLLPLVRESTSLDVEECETKGVIEPRSVGAKGAVKQFISALSRMTGNGDEIELTLGKPG
jgi:Methyltransferase domain